MSIHITMAGAISKRGTSFSFARGIAGPTNSQSQDLRKDLSMAIKVSGQANTAGNEVIERSWDSYETYKRNNERG